MSRGSVSFRGPALRKLVGVDGRGWRRVVEVGRLGTRCVGAGDARRDGRKWARRLWCSVYGGVLLGARAMGLW